jgi:hypothetical protein
MEEENKQLYIIVITVDVCEDDMNKENENTILEKCVEAIKKETHYEAWEVESYKIKEDEADQLNHIEPCKKLMGFDLI